MIPFNPFHLLMKIISTWSYAAQFFPLGTPSSRIRASCSFYLYTYITRQVFKLLINLSVAISLPTFIIAVCALIYLDPTSTGAIVSWASEKFCTAIFFLYEQVESFSHDVLFSTLMCDSFWHCWLLFWRRSIQMMHLGSKWLGILRYLFTLLIFMNYCNLCFTGLRHNGRFWAKFAWLLHDIMSK